MGLFGFGGGGVLALLNTSQTTLALLIIASVVVISVVSATTLEGVQTMAGGGTGGAGVETWVAFFTLRVA